MANEKTKEQLQEELKAAQGEIAELKKANSELNAELATAESAPTSAQSVKFGNKNYNIVVPQFHYKEKLIKTASVKGKELVEFCIDSGIVIDPKAEEGDEV